LRSSSARAEGALGATSDWSKRPQNSNGVEAVETYTDLRARALVVDVPDVGTVAFAGYHDVVLMKEVAGRPRGPE
jgi:hypothetical protein